MYAQDIINELDPDLIICHLCKKGFIREDMIFQLGQSIRLRKTTFRCKNCESICQVLHKLS